MRGTDIVKERPLPEGELLRLSRWQKPAMWALAGWILLLGGISVFIGVVDLAANGLSVRVITLVVGLLMVWWGVVQAGVPRSGLRVHRLGITIHEPVRKTRQRTWPEVDHFELGQSRWKVALRVHLTDGQVVNAIGLEWGRTRNAHVVEAWVEELNRRAAVASDLAFGDSDPL